MLRGDIFSRERGHGSADASRSEWVWPQSPRAPVRRAKVQLASALGGQGRRLEYPHGFECGLTMTQTIVDVDQREFRWWEVGPQHARLWVFDVTSKDTRGLLMVRE